MSYSAIASDLVFRSAAEAKWEQPPHGDKFFSGLPQEVEVYIAIRTTGNFK